VVTVLLGMPASPGPTHLDEAERAAICVLADSGLVPPLRLVPSHDPPGDGGTYDDPHGSRTARAG
jgi:hypothetical protein